MHLLRLQPLFLILLFTTSHETRKPTYFPSARPGGNYLHSLHVLHRLLSSLPPQLRSIRNCGMEPLETLLRVLGLVPMGVTLNDNFVVLGHVA